LPEQVEDRASIYKFSDGRPHCVGWDDSGDDDDNDDDGQ
jgi:hypothetical protein